MEVGREVEVAAGAGEAEAGEAGYWELRRGLDHARAAASTRSVAERKTQGRSLPRCRQQLVPERHKSGSCELRKPFPLADSFPRQFTRRAQLLKVRPAGQPANSSLVHETR